MKRVHTMRMPAVCLLLVLLLTACGEVPQATVQAEDDHGVPTVRIYSNGFDPAIDELINAYYARYPNVRVEKVTPSQQEMMQGGDSLITSRILDGSVDIVPNYGTMLQDNLLLPLDAYIQKSGFDTKPIASLLDSLRWNGHVYDLPVSAYASVLLYNADLFAKAGVAPPQPGMTWDEFRALAAKMTQQARYGWWALIPEQLVTVRLQQKTTQTKQPFTAADLTEALQFAATMVLTDKSVPQAEPRDWTQQGGVRFTGSDQFMAGKAAMTFGSLDQLRHGPTKTFKVGMTTLPSMAGGAGGINVYLSTLGIAANSRHADQAWQFLSFLAGPEGQAVYARAGVMPAYITPDTKQAWQAQDPPLPKDAELLLNTPWLVPPRQAPDTKGRKPNPAANPNVAANAVLSGQKSVADAVAAWEQATKK